MRVSATEIEAAPVRHVSETGSTNEDALATARAGHADALWIRADRQLSGRGRQGRVWESPAGNLYCSLLVPVAADPSVLPQLSQVAAVALALAMRGLVGTAVDLRIKWPNDILVGDAKVAGILVEATRTAAGHQICVIGCGVNCASFPENLPYRATSLAAASGRVIAPERLFPLFRTAMAEALATWGDGRGYPEIRKRWLAQALPLNTPLIVRGARAAIDGRFQGIDDKGRLLLMGPHGPVVVEAGDVTLN